MSRARNGPDAVTIEREQFEGFLPPAAEEVEVDGTDERVYEMPLPGDDLSVRVFSTIEGDSSRGYGEDAIRSVIWSATADGPVGGESKTLRIGTWRDNLRSKLEALYANWRDYDHGACPECGEGVMCERRPGPGDDWSPFLACSEWDGGSGCEHTKSL